MVPWLLGVLLLCSDAPVSGQTTLRWKFQPGQVFEQTITQNTTMLAIPNAQIPDRVLNQIIEATWTVGQVDAQGTAEVTQQITRIRMKIGTQVDIDSAAAQVLQGPMAAIAQSIQAMAKAKIQLKMSALGDIRDVELSQETLDALAALPKGAVSSVFSKETLVDMIQKSAQTLSPESLQKGTSWSSTAEIPTGQTGKVAYQQKKMTYLGSEDAGGKKLERIEMQVTTSLEKPAAAPAKTASSPAGSVVPGIKVNGTLYFDNGAGYMDHSELLQETVMPMTVGDKKLEQKVRTSIQVQLKPVARKP
jgi:hypothetical protein